VRRMITARRKLGASQRKLRMKTVRIAGTPLEPHYHNEAGDSMRDGWKSVWIGQSAARSDCSSNGKQTFSGIFAKGQTFRFVGSSSAWSYGIFVVQKDFRLFFLSSKEWKNLFDELNGESIAPYQTISGSPGFEGFALDMANGQIGNPLNGVKVTHRELDTGSELESYGAFRGCETFDQETSFSIHNSGDVSGFDTEHNSPLVQRLSREGVGASAPKRMASFSYGMMKEGDIVSSMQKCMAATSFTNVAVSVLQTDAKIRPFMGDEYFAIAWPTTWRPVKNDLESVYQYRDQGFQMIYNGEIGKYEGVRFIEQTNIAHGIYASGAFTAWTNGLSDWAFFFGEDTVAEALVIPEEMRGAIPSDYGRSKGVAWYYLGGFALTQTQAKQSRIVMWNSAK
jgi:hypothetical protein